MQKLNSKKSLFLYGISGFGINMLNLMIGSYLCDALMVEGFSKDVEFRTYSNKTLIVAAVWSIIILIAKILDGVIDIPIAGITDSLKTRFGRRRPAILFGLIGTIIFYTLFLFPIDSSAKSILNTIYFGIILCCFYCFYTVTMGTYYATFAEITSDDNSRVFLSNIKSIFDIIYFVLGYALIPILVGCGINIKIIGICVLPIALTMLIPLFMIKEKGNRKIDIENRVGNDSEIEKNNEEKTVGLIESIKIMIKRKTFWIWMLVFSFLQFGIQMFLTGMNVYYSGTLNMSGIKLSIVMASSFALVPLTLFLFNKIIKKKGFKFGFQYCLLSFSIGMFMLYFGAFIESETIRFILTIISGIIGSIGIGSFFSVSYIIPSQLASDEQKESGISRSAMYFAVQGLISGIATGLSTGIVWVNIKNYNLTMYMPLIVFAAFIVSYCLSFLLPKSISEIGLEKKKI